MTPDPRAEALAFIAIWAEHERASAVAADQYEAMPIAHRRGGRLHICTRCRCVVPERGLCRWCRRGLR